MAKKNTHLTRYRPKPLSRTHGYWAEHGPLQQTKHDILVQYFQKWVAILSTWSGRLGYIETHAGYGIHEDGSPGSPVRVMQALMEHRFSRRILRNSEVFVILMERDEDACKSLRCVMEEMKLPEKIRWGVINADFKKAFQYLLDKLKEKNTQIAPSLAFVDPFNYDIPLNLLNRFLAAGKTELIVTVMYRQINMDSRSGVKDEHLTRFFGDDSWKAVKDISGREAREKAFLGLIAEKLDARYTLWFRMCRAGDVLNHAILHASNHRAARKAMLDVMWRIAPLGDFTAYEKDHPEQGVLFTAEPDLTPLKEMFLHEHQGEVITAVDFRTWLENYANERLYRATHMNKAIRELRDEGRIQVEYKGSRYPKNIVRIIVP